MTRVLVSFANVVPGAPALALLDPDSLVPEIVRLPDNLALAAGVTGVALSPEHVFVATVQRRAPSRDAAVEPSRLLVFDRAHLGLVSEYVFRPGADLHSLHFSDDTLYAVSTGTDEVLALELRGGRVIDEQVLWRPEPDGPREDRHHMNAVTTVGGELAVSGFGKRAGALWSTATDGFIARVPSGERLATGLRHPHSPIDLGESLAYCDSATGAFRVVGTDRAQTLPGYVRGVCRVGDKLFVGTSIGRRVSRSRGVLTGRTHPGGDSSGQCTVSRLAVDDLSIETSVDLGSYAKEIYELVPVDGTEAWPRVSESEWRDVALRGAWHGYEEALAGLLWLHTEVAERDGAVESLHREIAQRDGTIEWLHREIAQRDGTIASLQAEDVQAEDVGRTMHRGDTGGG